MTEPELEARILRKVASALRSGFDKGWWAPAAGDGPDHVEPDSFDPNRAADELEREAAALEKGLAK